MCLPHSDDFQHALARSFVLAGWKVFPPSVNSLFRGNPFSHKGKIHPGHVQESLLLGRRTKGNFACCCCFRSKGDFCRKSPISTRRNDRLKPGKSLNLTWHIGHKTRQFSTSLLWCSGSRIFSNAGRFYWLTRYHKIYPCYTKLINCKFETSVFQVTMGIRNGFWSRFKSSLLT